MIKGVKKEPIPYVLEADRMNPVEEQTVFFILPKRGHDANVTLKRYGGASRDGRGGYREFNVDKLDAADVDEFKSIVTRIIRYQFSDGHIYSQKEEFKKGLVEDTREKDVIGAIGLDMSFIHMNEIFDAAQDISKLEDGRYSGKA